MEKNMSCDRVSELKKICDTCLETYEKKNRDYGNSFALVREKYPYAILIRLNDKLNRLETLMLFGVEPMVSEESVDDTLLDLANYCLMELVERKIDKENNHEI